MAVMNSLWLISRSQVGVWRLDFNTALWLYSACKIITRGKKNKSGIISYNTKWLWKFALDEESLHNLPCLGCSGLCYSGRQVNNSQSSEGKLDSICEYCMEDIKGLSVPACCPDLLSTVSGLARIVMPWNLVQSVENILIILQWYVEQTDNHCGKCTFDFVFLRFAGVGLSVFGF